MKLLFFYYIKFNFYLYIKNNKILNFIKSSLSKLSFLFSIYYNFILNILIINLK